MASKKTAAKASKKPASGKVPAKKPAAKAPVKAAAKRSAKPVAKSAAEKARREREVYKVSPLRGMRVDAWIEGKTSGWQSGAARRVRDVIAAAAPEATCSIKWGQPVWEHNGPFAFFKPARAHVSVGFWRGSEIADPKGILTRGDRMGHFKLLGPGDLDDAALTVMVKDAVRLNREKGTPTRK